MTLNRILLLLVALVLAACGRDGASTSPTTGAAPADAFATPFADAEAYPVIASSEIVVGESRFLVGLLDGNDAPIGSPEIEVQIAFFDLDRGVEIPAEPMDFIWAVKPQRGLYAAYPRFDAAGKWGAEIHISGDGIDETQRTSFEVAEQATTPAIGAPAPASETPTKDDVRTLKEISTDPNPDPRFYEVSVAEALKGGQPFVLVFSTPKFCSSQVCGPTLDTVKTVADRYPGMTFIHSEIYEGLDPSSPPVEAVQEWGLPSEPWVFVVDGDGKIAAKYEGTVAPKELAAVLDGFTR